MSGPTIAIVLPTRNRPGLAGRAIRSLLDQDVPIEIYVSDNSADSGTLRDFCRSKPNVHYLRPPGELAMPAHWDWALRTAMERSTATHFTVHYDRKLSKPGHWRRIAEAVASSPDSVVTFNTDMISDLIPPRRLWQPLWTDKAYSIETSAVTAAVASGQIMRCPQGFPVLSNCIVPRHVLEAVEARFGNLCDSTTPDGAFLFRFAALYDRYVHLDRSTGILHSPELSNGQGYLTGQGSVFGDFMKLHGGKPWLDAAPVPGASIGQNVLYHEYELVRRVTGDRLPALDREAVLADLGEQLRYIAEPELKAELRAQLVRHGWRGPEPAPFPQRRWRDVCRDAYRRLRLLLALEVRDISGMAFRSDDQALEFALRHPRKLQADAAHLAIFGPVEISR